LSLYAETQNQTGNPELTAREQRLVHEYINNGGNRARAAEPHIRRVAKARTLTAYQKDLPVWSVALDKIATLCYAVIKIMARLTVAGPAERPFVLEQARCLNRNQSRAPR
jgi:hypothetical protein